MPGTMSDLLCQTCSRPIPDLSRVHLGRCGACYMRWWRAGNRHKHRLCQTCGRTFETTRTDARTCSSACRQRAYRQRKALTAPATPP